jgi:hypothetical protein
MPIPILRPTQVSPEEANPFASGLSKLIQNIGPAMAQHQKLQQQQAMLPLQKQLLQSKIGTEEAKTQQALLSALSKPRADEIKNLNTNKDYAIKVSTLAAQDPNFLKDPRNQKAVAWSQKFLRDFPMKFQGLTQDHPNVLAQTLQQPQQAQVPTAQKTGLGLPPADQMQQMFLKGVLPTEQQVQPIQQEMMTEEKPQQYTGQESEPSLSQEQLDSVRLDQAADRAKRYRDIVPNEQKVRIDRFVSANEAMKKAEPILKKYLKYLKPGESYKRAAENYAADLGIPLRQATQELNVAFNTTIPFVIKDLAPAFRTPSAEKTYARFEKALDPKAFGQPEQLMRNFAELQRILMSGLEGATRTTEQTMQAGQKALGEYKQQNVQSVPRGPQSVQTQQYSPEYIDKLRARKAELSASRRGG